MTFTFRPQGVCSSQMRVELNKDLVIEEVEVIGGCHGNSQGLAALLKGMNAKEAVARLQGICCGLRSTSCPDQIAKGLEKLLEQEAKTK